MSKKMLIDAAHAEETRVAVIDGNRIEEFDFESQSHKQLRGNIYLAKVTRVEPSLQAAFIEYGGNRHGFLAFNEIHPDYYQIPVADREALMAEEAADEEEDEVEAPRERDVDEDGEDAAETLSGDGDDDVIEQELARRRRRLMRRYKIQEVIRRRQIMLVQVVKEERGNKGAALTTYLSLAGRYCVLMPNTARGGGISRKITSATDRKRLKSVVQGLDVPEGMGLIVRTAGAKRTKAEIKRDYDYLLRLWENIRETTLHSVAPSLIYEEEDLVKRTIRDLYDKDIDEVLVEGEAGFREAREFMRMLMPSQARKVQAYREPTPLFVKHRVEDHLAQIYSPVAPLKSGGYLVINQTEALVAIDVNSGRATRERNVEATALRTNLEAAEEAARQLRLRDLAGLVVIDFIDMDESKNNRAVEKKLKDALKEDRARIQVGRISTFGLMELSRQRRRSSLLEGTTHVCEHCGGTGRVRSVESSALGALRAVEMEA
ncbi:ribonuclease E/G, partial [Phenylobacterium sp.]